MGLPVSRKLPLRSSTVWGEYTEPRTLPVGYGRVTLTPFPYDDTRRWFFLLDHAIEGVDAVRRDRLPTPAWVLHNTQDATGHGIALLEMDDPLADGEDLEVDLRGRRHPVTGALITNPATRIWDTLANLFGLDLAESTLDAFRAETQRRSMESHGLVDDPDQTLRAHLDAVCQGLGAVWSGNRQGLATLWPLDGRPADAPLWARMGKLEITGPVAETRSGHLATAVRALYDYDHATGQHRKALLWEAPDAIARYGRIELELDAGTVRAPHQAAELGRRVLEYRARPLWEIPFTAGPHYARIPPGSWVELDHPRLPFVGATEVFLARAAIDLERAVVEMRGLAPAGPSPRVELVQQSGILEEEADLSS